VKCCKCEEEARFLSSLDGSPYCSVHFGGPVESPTPDEFPTHSGGLWPSHSLHLLVEAVRDLRARVAKIENEQNPQEPKGRKT